MPRPYNRKLKHELPRELYNFTQCKGRQISDWEWFFSGEEVSDYN